MQHAENQHVARFVSSFVTFRIYFPVLLDLHTCRRVDLAVTDDFSRNP